MPRPALHALLVLAGISISFGTSPSFAEERLPLDDAKRLFGTEVRPLLIKKCVGCHGQDEQESGLDLSSLDATLAGGDTGEPTLVPGHPEKSLLYEAVTWENEDLQMPPMERNRLTEKEVAVVRRWIAAGAPWPEKMADEWNVADGVQVETSGGLSPDWTNRRYKPEDIWAYQPLREVAVPWDAVGGDTSANPIDAFIARKLKVKEIPPSQPADRLMLIRRATYDLTGLPPTPEEVEAFLSADDYEAACARLVDDLLARPAYGEQMARHWLDVVRYADTAGFSNDFERPHAWRYRDYVIRNFNQDKPYDRFVLEQIAGDELDPSDPEMRIAVGYLRMGPWEHTGMSVAAVTRQLWLDDVTNSVGVSFLGQGLRCASCHDHKFDPIPTRDYYRLQAVFASTRFDEPNAQFLKGENTEGFDQSKQIVERRLKTTKLRPIEFKKGTNALGMINSKRNSYYKLAIQRFDPKAFSVKTSSSDKVHILTGGALDSPGDAVEPGVLSCVPEEDEVPASRSGRRLALAKWIADENNPLTARVLVNRVWQMHFGTGLVSTPNNFGKMGGRPSHPELLDWLAQRFMDEGWSIKKLHRLIMSSDAYQRSSTHSDMELIAERDPNNALLAYFPPRRLAAEELRDAMLAVTGELSDTRGGPPVFPTINREVALQPRHVMGGIAPAYQESPKPEQRNRRTIYAARIRTLSNPMLEVLNRPGCDTSCERRDETIVTPQVFALFNSQFAHDRAIALARRLEQSSGDRSEQIDEAFRLLLGRAPTSSQRESCLAHVAAMTEHHRANPPEPVERPVVVRREMVEEQTGAPFAWEEVLDTDHIEPDLKPWEVSAETRALAELCLVLLNSNEFVYVY